MSGNLNMVELAREMDATGRWLPVIETLAQANPVHSDANWMEGNLATGHEFAEDLALPTISKRAVNQGVKPTKGRGGKVTETCGMYFGSSTLDVDLAAIGGDVAQARLRNDRRFIQAFRNGVERDFFYGNRADDSRGMNGLFPRIQSLTSGPAKRQIIDATSDNSAGSQDKTSIAIVCWGDDKVSMIAPKGMSGALDVHPYPDRQRVLDENGDPYPAYVTDYTWKPGVAVMNYEYMVRIANIDLDNMSSDPLWLWECLIRGVNRLSDALGDPTIRARMYMHPDVAAEMEVQAMRGVKNATLGSKEIGGQTFTTFRDIPIRKCRGILLTEDVIT